MSRAPLCEAKQADICSATMVTAILPSLTNENDDDDASGSSRPRLKRGSRHSAAFSIESEATITPELYNTRVSSSDHIPQLSADAPERTGKTSALAGYVGLFTGCGALVALTLFLPLPATFGNIHDVTPRQAVSYSFYVVGAVALLVALFVFFGLRDLRGEDDKGWRALFGLKTSQEDTEDRDLPQSSAVEPQIQVISPVKSQSSCSSSDEPQKTLPYLHLLKDSVLLGITDSRIALGYIGGFVARASTVAISLFIPLYINTFFIDNGFCHGSPNDPSPELKKECRAAYVLSSILTGVAQLVGLMCAPIFGYVSSRRRAVNYPIVVATVFGMVGYVVFPHLASPEIKNVDGRGGTPAIFIIVSLIGISQIGAIVCSLGSLGRGVLAAELPRTGRREASLAPDEDESAENEPLIRISADEASASRIQLKGSIAGVYSLFGGAAILLLAKLGGFLFDNLSHRAPFYMMAIFNAMLLVASLLMDASRTYSRN